MNIEMTEKDAITIKAILMTHTEMQDQRALSSEELLSRLRRDNTGTDDEQQLIADLANQIETFEDDCIDLRRLADLIPVELN